MAQNVTRRGFLKGAAALAAPLIVRSSALGKAGAVAPSNRIVMAGIGIGGRGSHDLARLIRWPDVQFVAVAEVRGDRRARVKATIDRHNGNTDCTPYIDFRKLLTRTDIDSVLIATLRGAPLSPTQGEELGNFCGCLVIKYYTLSHLGIMADPVTSILYLLDSGHMVAAAGTTADYL